jgi:HK97 family phage portal protein
MKIFGYEIKRDQERAISNEGFQQYMRMLREFVRRDQVIPIDDRPSEYIKHGFARNPVVYSIVMLRANSAKAVPWLVYKVKNQQKLRQYKAIENPTANLHQTLHLKEQSLAEVEGTALNRLIEKPNAMQSFSDVIEELFVYRDVTGNAYIYMPTNPTTGHPLSLHVAPADKVRIVGESFLDPIKGYLIEAINQTPLDPDNVIHWKYINPKWGAEGRDLYGMSPLHPAAAIIAQDNVAIDGQSAAFLNEGLKGVITGTNQTDIEFSKEQAEAMREKFEKSSGFRNRGKLQFNRAPLQFLKIGETPVDLGTLEARRANKETLCNIFRVHPALLSSEASTLDNLKEARKMLLTTSVLPDMDSLKQHLNKRVARQFGPEYYLDYDLMAVTELQDDLSKIAGMLLQMDWITDNEKRIATQYDRFEDPAADMLYKQAGLVPMGFDFDTGFTRIDEELNKRRK